MTNKYHIFFTNLANPLKISIVLSLKKGSKNVSEIINEIGGEQSKVSHALSNLRKCNIVEVEKKGKQRVYSLNKKTIIPILKLIDSHVKHCCKGNCKECKGK